MKLQWYSKKWVVILLHTALWVLLFSLPFLLHPSYDNNVKHKEPVQISGFEYHYFFTCLTWIAFFYLNALVLIPRLIYKARYAQYIAAQIVVLAVLILLNWLSYTILVRGPHFDIRNFFVFNLFPYLFILASSWAYQMFLYRAEVEKQAKEKETENLKTELSFLRSQVSPHFMFNVLNNMVALARKKSDLLEPSLIKLSSLLRYMLYETDEAKVLLSKEIEYLQSYIDLQHQRFGKSVCIHACLQQIDKDYQLEPMLLIPFVENAFKHGTGLIENAQIDIELKAKNNLLQFLVRNKYNPAEAVKDKTSGIGLTNVKRRLNLLYKGNHSLLINKNEEWFTISLQLNLH